jgi:hypothetical protein
LIRAWRRPLTGAYLSWLAVALFAAPVLAQAPPTGGRSPVSANLSARNPVGKEAISGADLCRFVHVPELVMRGAGPEKPATAEYVARSRENPNVRFVVRMTGGRAVEPPTWRSQHGKPAFIVDASVHDPTAARFHSVLLDGADTGLRLDDIRTSPASGEVITGKPVRDVILPILAPEGDEGGWAHQLDALQRGSTLLLIARTAQGEVGRYAFDIRTLHFAPSAFVASDGTCP